MLLFKISSKIKFRPFTEKKNPETNIKLNTLTQD